jgi:hypothetical protein
MKPAAMRGANIGINKLCKVSRNLGHAFRTNNKQDGRNRKQFFFQNCYFFEWLKC